MMNIDINSWHYKLAARRRHENFTSIPDNLCPYTRYVLWQLFAEVVIAALCAFFLTFFGAIVLDPLITMVGFWIGNGFSSGLLPHMTYLSCYMEQMLYLIITVPFGADVVFDIVRPAVATAGLGYLGYFEWFIMAFPLWAFFFCVGVVLLVLGGAVVAFKAMAQAVRNMHTRKIIRMSRASTEKPLSTLDLFYQRVLAHKQKICPQISFTDSEGVPSEDQGERSF